MTLACCAKFCLWTSRQPYPCVMNGSMNTFYKTNVSAVLVRAVERAQYRTHPTTLHKLTPPVERLRLVPGRYEVAQQ